MTQMSLKFREKKSVILLIRTHTKINISLKLRSVLPIELFSYKTFHSLACCVFDKRQNDRNKYWTTIPDLNRCFNIKIMSVLLRLATVADTICERP